MIVRRKSPLSHELFFLLVALLTIPYISCKDEDESSFIEDVLPARFLDIGPGRNDGVNRAYGIVAENLFEYSGIDEYTFENGSWQQTGAVTDKPASQVVIENLKADDAYHLIALGHRYIEDSYNIAYQYFVEFTFDAGTWTSDTIYQTVFETSINWFVTGKFSNEGNRSLLFLEISFNGSRVYEVYHAGNGWETRLVDLEDDQDPFIDVDAGDVRGLGRDHIYITSRSGKLYEYSFDGSWNKAEMPELFTGVPGVSYAYSCLVAVAPEEGLLFAHGFENFYQYRYENGSWTKEVVSEQLAGPFQITYGNFRNDGIGRIYVPAIFGVVYEITPDLGLNKERKYTLHRSDAVQKMLIADGRNDGVNRIYCSQDFTNNLELTFR